MPRRSRFALSLLLVLLSGFRGSAEEHPPAGFVEPFVWRLRDDAFGGLSGIEVLDGGRRFVVLGDKAMIISGQLDRDRAGRIVGVTAGPIRPLMGAKGGKPLAGRRADSEGLAIDDAGQAFVSFENRPRVAHLEVDSGTVSEMPPNPAFARLPRNGALEALAVGEGPTLYAVPEDPPTKDIPVYRWADGDWIAPLSLPRRGSFSPVAADILAGRLYLLERDFRGLGGFASRLRRFDIADSGLTGEVTLFVTPFGTYDNLEGLSVWRDVAGTDWATMISDDNFFLLQQTQIVEFRLPD